MVSRHPFVARPYQRRIVDYVLGSPRCAIWAGMGLGKTVSTLTALDTLTLLDDQPTLVVAPLRVAQSTWPDEARKWAHLAHLDVVPVVGALPQRVAALARPAQI